MKMKINENLKKTKENIIEMHNEKERSFSVAVG